MIFFTQSLVKFLQEPSIFNKACEENLGAPRLLVKGVVPERSGTWGSANRE